MMEENSKLERETVREITAYYRKLASGLLFTEKGDKYPDFHLVNLSLSQCRECSQFAIWLHTRMLWRPTFEAPLPSEDMPELVRKDYLEAAEVFPHSAKAAAALLRLAIQHLCMELGEDGKNINEDIAVLVRKGLDPQVQKALDIVRVTGNNAVHPGTMSEDDVRATAEKLFNLVNIICEYMITRPKHIDELFVGLPPGALEQIKRRDGGRRQGKRWRLDLVRRSPVSSATTPPAGYLLSGFLNHVGASLRRWASLFRCPECPGSVLA
ncbi:DUF4145 domain-containing protein [Mesorhizobium sp. WSM2239]|uniref:DUF4145 domain-containing protein n=2 Tax=unclassified Mesorhizobium TaxID=325217 RepID=A0AAU8D719_9HYPH